MKTAQEWDLFFQERYDRKKHPEFEKLSQFDFFKDMCEQIQLDSIKAGMTMAARLVARNFELPLTNGDCGPIESTILTTRDNMKELP